MEIHCTYCPWIGQYPSTAEYSSLEEYEAAIKALDAEHAAQCPGPYKTS